MEKSEPPLLEASDSRSAATRLVASYTFRAEDERRLFNIVGRVTMRLPFLFVLAAVAPLFLVFGIAVATEELLEGIFVALVGLGVAIRVVVEFRLRSAIKRQFRESIGSSPSCSWVIDDDGIASMDRTYLLRWSSFSNALFCPEGLVLSGGAFFWMPKEAFSKAEDFQALRPIILKHRIRCEERA
jgi:hypothetical protein